MDSRKKEICSHCFHKEISFAFFIFIFLSLSPARNVLILSTSQDSKTRLSFLKCCQMLGLAAKKKTKLNYFFSISWHPAVSGGFFFDAA